MDACSSRGSGGGGGGAGNSGGEGEEVQWMKNVLCIYNMLTNNRTLAGCESVTDRDSTTHNTPCWNNDHT